MKLSSALHVRFNSRMLHSNPPLTNMNTTSKTLIFALALLVSPAVSRAGTKGGQALGKLSDFDSFEPAEIGDVASAGLINGSLDDLTLDKTKKKKKVKKKKKTKAS